MVKNMKEAPKKNFALDKKNFRFILIGLLIMVAGYILLVGGGSKDPNVFNEAGLFRFHRMVIAPLVICAGFAFEAFAIMHIFKK